MKSNNAKGFILTFFLAVVALLITFPFIWMIISSFKTNSDITTIPIKFLPRRWTVEGYTKVLQKLPFGALYINTLITMAARSLISIVISIPAGYALARLNFKGKKLILFIVLAQLMIPYQVFMIPQFLMVASLGLLNTIAALIFPGVVSIYAVFLMRQFFMSLPNELEEAAILDGCNHWMIVWRIMAPLSGAVVSSLAILMSLWTYKDLMWPLVVNMKKEKLTLTPALALITQGMEGPDYAKMMAGAVLSVWPMIVIYFIGQRRFVEGIATTGVKQ